MPRSSAVILSLSLAVLGAIVWSWWPDVAAALALENSPFAWLQSSLLVACASVAGVLVLHREPAEGRWLWLLLSLLLVVAALDERFMGHERLQEHVFYGLLDGNPALRWMPSLLMLFVAGAGLALLLALRRHMSPETWCWCRMGLGLGLVAIVLDVTVDSVSVQILEELLEALAEALFLCGLFREAGRPVRHCR